MYRKYNVDHGLCGARYLRELVGMAEVSFDKNQAKRDIRMITHQQKIFGGWHSTCGARAVLDLRSYLPTARKNNRAAIDVLLDLFPGNPWMLTPAGPILQLRLSLHRSDASGSCGCRKNPSFCRVLERRRCIRVNSGT